jgi:alkylation response protein AidB-like acyl-CoA dehydrogenase
VNLELTRADRELSERARAFTTEHLIPFELECEMNNGLSDASLAGIRAATVEWGFNAINHSVEDGGQGLDLFQQALVQEQMGKSTGALWDVEEARVGASKSCRKWQSTPTPRGSFAISGAERAHRRRAA